MGLPSLIFWSCLLVWLAHEQIKRSKQFFRILAMSSSLFFVAGSIHQGQERFSDKSRERQRSFMSFSALLCTQTLSIEIWTSTIVDQILFEGDKMHLNAFERRIIPGTDALSLVYLPDRARSLPIDTQRNRLPIEVTTPNQWSPIDAKNFDKSIGHRGRNVFFAFFCTNDND